MKAHVIENDIVVNTIEVESLDLMDNLVEATSGGIGWAYINGSFIAPQEDQAEIEAGIRAKRNGMLVRSDWTQVVDATVDQAAWAAYRQALRDIPSQAGFPNEVIWPTEPE